MAKRGVVFSPTSQPEPAIDGLSPPLPGAALPAGRATASFSSLASSKSKVERKAASKKSKHVFKLPSPSRHHHDTAFDDSAVLSGSDAPSSQQHLQSSQNSLFQLHLQQSALTNSQSSTTSTATTNSTTPSTPTSSSLTAATTTGTTAPPTPATGSKKKKNWFGSLRQKGSSLLQDDVSGEHGLFTTLSIEPTPATPDDSAAVASSPSLRHRGKLKRSNSITHSILLQPGVQLDDSPPKPIPAAPSASPPSSSERPSGSGGSSGRPNLQSWGRKMGAKNLQSVVGQADGAGAGLESLPMRRLKGDLDRIDSAHSGFDSYPLLSAAQANSLARVFEVLSSTPHINLNLVDPFGWSSIHYAAQHGNLPMCFRLLEAGIDAGLVTKDTGDNALHLLARHAFSLSATPLYRNVLELLLQAGSSIHQKNHLRESPLYILLRNHGADAAALL
ncbi:MAG: ankyrin repeat domain-containing protein, partial [archaeon]|nr:ankyrin repeat domain-containing protein [archaeon]